MVDFSDDTIWSSYIKLHPNECNYWQPPLYVMSFSLVHVNLNCRVALSRRRVRAKGFKIQRRHVLDSISRVNPMMSAVRGHTYMMQRDKTFSSVNMQRSAHILPGNSYKPVIISMNVRIWILICLRNFDTRMSSCKMNLDVGMRNLIRICEFGVYVRICLVFIKLGVFVCESWYVH